jgi:hypothetical protein
VAGAASTKISDRCSDFPAGSMGAPCLNFPSPVNRVDLFLFVPAPDAAMLIFATKGMECWLGHSSKPSWALSHVHVKWLNDQFNVAWIHTQSKAEQHDIDIAAAANLLVCLGWLRGGERLLKLPKPT